MFDYENKYLKLGKKFIAGIDEAGRGPLAGPVACCAVIMPLDSDKIIDGVNDSKKLSPKKRDELYEKIKQTALDYSVVFVSEKEIDEINILNATKKGMSKCIDSLRINPNIILVDAVKGLDTEIECESIIKGDSLSYSIACASILAKVERDRMMEKYDKEFIHYEFSRHKGYGTKLHIELLKKYGPCKIHRRSFIKNFIGDESEIKDIG